MSANFKFLLFFMCSNCDWKLSKQQTEHEKVAAKYASAKSQAEELKKKRIEAEAQAARDQLVDLILIFIFHFFFLFF